MRKGQTLSELAIFSSILLLLLGILINYGLRYNAQQQAIQKAFREAMVSASQTGAPGTPVSVSHLVIKDLKLPDPSHPFALGATTTVTASASVTRSIATNFPDPYNTNEWPQMRIEINDLPPINIITAGVRAVPNVTSANEKKYLVIYGAGNVDRGPETSTWSATADDPEYAHQNAVPSFTLYVLDNCDGEIINYESALARCRQITNYDACMILCQKDPNETGCSSICSQTIEVPWYCGAGVLDKLFAVSPTQPKGKPMGVSGDYREISKSDNVLTRQESPSGITTTDKLSWQDTLVRGIIYRPLTDRSGATATREATSVIREEKSSPWSTTR
jgi:hypothetical protein